MDSANANTPNLKIKKTFIVERIEGYNWAKELPCGITVCDKTGIIIYINDCAATTFSKYGDSLIGHSLFEYHGTRSADIIRKMLSDGIPNSYTIEKEGIKKLIHQMAWYENGQIAGLVELSIIIPFDMPHFVRG